MGDAIPMNGTFPRELTRQERELLDFVLPPDRPGYRFYRELIDGMVVLGQGRRGPGNLVLGKPGYEADNTSPLGNVVAFGVLETTEGEVSVTVREFADDQIDVELASSPGEATHLLSNEIRRWTYSEWKSGAPSPRTGEPVREVSLSREATLVISVSEGRIWVYNALSGMNLLIPVTGFHEEIMRLEAVRDPAIALHPELLFDNLERYTDETIKGAFLSYNMIHPKIRIDRTSPSERPEGHRSVLRRLLSFGRSHG